MLDFYIHVYMLHTHAYCIYPVMLYTSLCIVFIYIFLLAIDSGAFRIVLFCWWVLKINFCMSLLRYANSFNCYTMEEPVQGQIFPNIDYDIVPYLKQNVFI